VDVIAPSVLSGAHMTLFPEVMQLMRERGIAERLLTGGGIIPNEDMATLAAQGVGRLFGPGTNTQDIVAYIREWYAGVHGAGALPPLPPPPPSPEPMVEPGERRVPAPAPARDRRHAKPAPARAASGSRAAGKPRGAKPAPRARAASKPATRPGRRPVTKQSRAAARPARKPARKK
jgi:methylmalonyl-CoA mutase C-terminal domain/subunit